MADRNSSSPKPPNILELIRKHSPSFSDAYQRIADFVKQNYGNGHLQTLE